MNQLRPVATLLFLALAFAGVGSGTPSPVSAQANVQQLIQERTGQQLTSAQILERLRTSGVSRDQAKARLRQAGYDPAIVDPYYDRLESGEGVLPDPSEDFLTALSALGLAEEGTTPSDPFTLQPEQRISPDTIPGRRAGQDTVPQVFGLDVFRRATDQFQPVTTGPVDQDYRLGPGDQLVLILTGAVEQAYTLDVTREGFIVIPDVGQLSVNGLTLEGLRDRLYDRLGRVYSGVRRGADATTHFDVSLGRLRTNQVFVIGDVARPGAFQVSSVATVLNALYRAGGPTAKGSFRAIRVQRGQGIAAELDLYDYLLEGDAGSDIRLNQGDIVFVPPAGPQVMVRGKVRRPAIYEMKPGQTLAHALAFAGGFEPEAYIQRIQIDRILPPQEREPGRDRVLLDVDVSDVVEAEAAPTPIRDGDRVTVYGVLDRQVQRLSIMGDVWRPGEYEFAPGMTVWDLVGRADGLLPSAFRQVAHIRRLVPESGATRLLRVSLETDAQGRPLEDEPLEDLDEVVVFSVERLRTPESVEIFGEVKEEGTYPLDRAMTVEDLILAAGGFTAGARAYEAEVVRLVEGTDRSNQVSTRFRVRLEGGLPHPLGERAYQAPEGTAEYDALAQGLSLQDGDQVFVRRLAGFVTPTHVRVAGEVFYPGAYAFEFRQERLSSFVQRAGGLTEEAYPEGARLVRDSLPVGVDLQRALARPGSPEDVILEPGDELVIPGFDPTVEVQGAVAFPSRVVYRDGMGVGDFLGQAGGAVDGADLGRISVEYPNGERATTWKFLFFRNQPDVRPGSTIYVPPQPEGSGTDWDQFFTRTLSITSSVLTILIAMDRLGG